MFNPPHPGEILKDLYLEPLGLTVTATAKAIGVSRIAMSELVNGKNGVSPTMAYRLSKAFGQEPRFWLNLQTQYNLAKVRERAAGLAVEVLYVPPDLSQ